MIDLSTVSTDLTKVRTLSIGVDSSTRGILMLDDIHLYANDPTAERILIESESGTLPSPWVTLADTGASGGQYIDTAEGTANSTNAPLATGIATYNVTVAGGAYKISLLVSGIVDYNTDSLWIRIPSASEDWARCNGLAGQYDTATGGWQWIEAKSDNGVETTYTLPAGSHTLEIAIVKLVLQWIRSSLNPLSKTLQM